MSDTPGGDTRAAPDPVTCVCGALIRSAKLNADGEWICVQDWPGCKGRGRADAAGADDPPARVTHDADGHTLRRLAELERERDALRAYAKAVELWEADLVTENAAWEGEYPRMTAALYRRWMELQAQRNAALSL